MRRLVSTLIQFAGITCLTVAAFEVSAITGTAVLGVALVVVGHIAEGS